MICSSGKEQAQTRDEVQESFDPAAASLCLSTSCSQLLHWRRCTQPFHHAMHTSYSPEIALLAVGQTAAIPRQPNHGTNMELKPLRVLAELNST
jgi:hypothetical protein